MFAGLIRFTFEDCYNGLCSPIFLCKIWNDDKVGAGSKAFTVASIACGILCSFLGPLVDFLTIFELKADERCGQTATDDLLPILAAEAANHVQMTRAVAQEQADKPEKKPAPKASERLSQSKFGRRQKTPFALLRNDSLLQLLRSPRFTRDGRLQKALVLASILYWTSMALLFFVLGRGRVEIPEAAWLLYFFMTMFRLLVELWTALHSLFEWIPHVQAPPHQVLGRDRVWSLGPL